METSIIQSNNYTTSAIKATNLLSEKADENAIVNTIEKSDENPVTSNTNKEPMKVIMDEKDVKNFLYMMIGLDIKVESGNDKIGINVNSLA